MIKYITPILFFCALNSLAVQAFKRKFGQVLPVTLTASVIVMYLTQFLFHTFRAGTLFLFAAAGISMLVLCVRRKRWHEFFTPGLAAFVIICLFVSVMNYHRHFIDFDEFWHWGMMIKESLRLDRFYCVEASRMVIHKDYPPFLTLFELIWVKASGYYMEGIATTAVMVLELSVLICPLTEDISEAGRGENGTGIWKKLFRTAAVSFLLLLLFLLLINVFDFAGDIATLLADIPLGVFFAFSLLLILNGEAFHSAFGYTCLVLDAIMLIMLKQVGIAMLLVVLAAYLLTGFFAEGKRSVKFLASWIMLGLIPFCTYFSWNAYVRTMNISDIRASSAGGGQFDLSKISVHEYLRTALGQNPGLQQDTFRDLLKAFVVRPISAISWLPITYLAASALIFLILLVINRRFKKDFDDRRMAVTAVSLLCGTIGYAFMLSVLFLFCFVPAEMWELRGYERYVDTYIIGELLALVCFGILLLCRTGRTRFRIRNLTAAVLAGIILTGGEPLMNIGPQSLRENPFEQYEAAAAMIRNYSEEDSAITVIYDIQNGRYGSWYGSFQAVAYYHLNDRDLLRGMDLFSADYSDKGKKAEALQQVKESDYLFVINTNDMVNMVFSEYNHGRALSENVMYKVNNTDSGMELQECSSV